MLATVPRQDRLTSRRKPDIARKSPTGYQNTPKVSEVPAHECGSYWRRTSCLCDCHYGGKGCDDPTCQVFRVKEDRAA